MTIAAAILLAASMHLTIDAQAGAIGLAWDPNPPENKITGYTVGVADVDVAGGCSARWTEYDAGNVTEFRFPAGTIDLTKPHCFGARAYRADGERSDYATIVFTPTATDVLCAPPFGTKAVQLFAGRVVGTTGSVGSRAYLQFQIASPGALVQTLSVTVGSDAPRTVAGQDLLDIGSVWFRAPAAPGTYPITLEAINAAGCHAILTKAADGKPLTITVK